MGLKDKEFYTCVKQFAQKNCCYLIGGKYCPDAKVQEGHALYVEESTKTSVVKKIAFLRDSYHFKDGDKTFKFHVFRNRSNRTRDLEHYGPPQVKCRLLISSIFDVRYFQHFSEML